METITDRVVRFMNANMRIPEGATVIMSLSAGKDSMCMLDILNSLRERLSIKLAAFHLNHMTRGVDSLDDQRFIAERCAAYGVPLDLQTFDFPSNPQKGMSFEEHARSIRYSILDGKASSIQNSRVATAHTRDDKIETVLMRIFTGTGVYGLRGIDPSRGIYLRPLLCIRSEEAYTYLEERDLPWREDLSNDDDRYSRNFIRNRIIPVVDTKFPMAGDAILSLSEQSHETMDFLRRLIEDRYGPVYRIEGDSVVIDAHFFGGDVSSLSEAIAAAMRERFGAYIRKSIMNEILRKLFIQRTNLLLYENADISVYKKNSSIGPRVVIRKTVFNKCNNLSWEYTLSDITSEEQTVTIDETGAVLRFRIVEREYFYAHRNDSNSSFIEYNDVPVIVIRNRRNGDRLVLENGSKKIKDYFIEKKLDSIQKDRIVLITVKSSIAALIPSNHADMPARVALPFKIKDSSRKILAVRW